MFGWSVSWVGGWEFGDGLLITGFDLDHIALTSTGPQVGGWIAKSRPTRRFGPLLFTGPESP